MSQESAGRQLPAGTFDPHCRRLGILSRFRVGTPSVRKCLGRSTIFSTPFSWRSWVCGWVYTRHVGHDLTLAPGILREAAKEEEATKQA